MCLCLVLFLFFFYHGCEVAKGAGSSALAKELLPEVKVSKKHYLSKTKAEQLAGPFLIRMPRLGIHADPWDRGSSSRIMQILIRKHTGKSKTKVHAF